MKRSTIALMAVAFAPAAAFAQNGAPPSSDASGFRPIGLPASPSAHPTSGPSPRGPGTWEPLGPFGGDMVDVNVSPTSPNIVLAASSSLYRSTDSGATWNIVPNVVAVYDIEFTPTGDVWIATNDSAFVSTDNGATFTERNFGIGLNDQTFAIEIDPSNSSVLWAGVADAIGSQPVNVLKSTDGGIVWNDVTPPGVAGTSATDIAINPSNTNQVMVTFGGAFGGGAVYYTADGGSSWTDVSAGLPSTPALTVAYNSGMWLVGGGQLFGGQDFGIWRGSADGSSWTQLDDATWPNQVVTDIAVDPANPNVILASTTDGVHKSTDAGATWTISSGNSASFSLNSVRLAPGSSTRVLMGANSFGVILSDDAAATTRVSSNGIGSLDVFWIAANPLDTDELAVAFQGQNNGGVYTSTNGGDTWTVETGLPGTRYNLVKFDAAGTLFAISDGPTGIAPEGLYRRNPDSSWTLLGPDQGTFFESELFDLDFGLANPNLFLMSGADFGVAGFEATIWRSPDAGAAWTKVYEGPTGQGAVAYAVHIVKDGTDNTAVAGLQSFTSDPAGLNGVFRSTDSGQTWGRVTSGLPESLWGYSLEAAPDNVNRLYVTDGNFSGGGIWVSSDAGANWENFLTGFNTRGTAIDPNNSDSVYFWTVFAPFPVYQATQNGTVITPASDGITGSPRQIVRVEGDNPRILLATSNGAYQLSLAAPCTADFNKDGFVNSQDFFDFLAAFFSQEPAADYNGDTFVNSQDFFDFLADFFVGCP
ncbi:MAG: hypothetical protein H7210_09565 [Pyrinomonadaceae bacterium]|nr:hypothetical protein [Phycisphaerales bacterium]